MTDEVFGGAMSGTSLDGVDVVLARFRGDPAATSGQSVQVLAHAYQPYPAELRERILLVCHGQPLTLPQLGALDLAVARQYVQAISAALRSADLVPAQVRAIGAHGQTVFHQPDGADRFTLQIGDPNTVAVGTGVPIVADFRRRDMALGGQGAPLAPGLHDTWFRHPDKTRVVLNGGGIANITAMVPSEPTYGFDTGPANVLMDAWCQRHTGQAFDADGRWASGGSVLPALLDSMLQEPYLRLGHPKSTGRELFHLQWVEHHLASLQGVAAASVDVMRTLLEFSARTVADAVAAVGRGEGELYVCGGAAMNGLFMRRLADLLPRWRVASTAECGIAPDQVEAIAFASFARRTLHGLPGNLPAVTGASRPCILGALYVP